MADNRYNNGNNSGIFGKGPYDENPDKYKQSKGFLRNSLSGFKTLVLAIISIWGLIISIVNFINKR